MKSVYLNKKQYQFIKESIKNNPIVSSWVSKKIENGDTPLSSDKKYINEALIEMLNQAYENAIGVFSDDITSFDTGRVIDKLNKLILICQRKEEKIRTELEKLCSDLVLSLFELNGKNFELECNLVDNIPDTKDFHLRPDTNVEIEYSNIDEINEEDSDEVRRHYTNAITMGASLELTDLLLKKSLQEIFELDEELPHLYNKIIKINDYLLLVKEGKIDDKQKFQDAYNEVTVFGENNKVKILSEGLIFPFLLTETIRGCIEAISSSTLPEGRAEYIINKCDVLEDEPMYMIFGREIWKKICGEGFDEIYSEKLLQKLFSLENDNFNRLMEEVVVGTKLGKEAMNKVISKIKYDSDYKSFEKDLEKKREEKSIIEDSYYSEDELNEEAIDEAEYPSTFNMEEFKQLRDFSKRVKYCKERLKYLGRGSSRIVFQIDESTVLKLAFNQKGIAQNEAEAAVKNDYVLSGYNFLPEVYDVDDQYLWIEMQIARRANQSDFKKFTGYSWKVFYYWVINCWNNSVAPQYARRYIPDEYSVLFNSNKFYEYFDYTLFDEIRDYIGNYAVEGYLDLIAIRNWGVVKDKNGEERLVLIDNGLSNDVIKKYY